ncbi:hypothetical protein LCGC14_2447790 [marine sediment metagenome]|uniref:Uncharacterized protein n=1 Tax=marine sediment metagenome TaxID=412755 RepID=A0A0F9BH65_9ZZZZ
MGQQQSTCDHCGKSGDNHAIRNDWLPFQLESLRLCERCAEIEAEAEWDED